MCPVYSTAERLLSGGHGLSVGRVLWESAQIHMESHAYPCLLATPGVRLGPGSCFRITRERMRFGVFSFPLANIMPFG